MVAQVISKVQKYMRVKMRKLQSEISKLHQPKITKKKKKGLRNKKIAVDEKSVSSKI